jgi:hypothetical protein
MDRTPRYDPSNSPLNVAGVAVGVAAVLVALVGIYPDAWWHPPALAIVGLIMMWVLWLLTSTVLPERFRGPTKRSISRQWPVRWILERTYGRLVPLVIEHNNPAGGKHRFWMCPYCDHGNEGLPQCERCGAIYDEKRSRAKPAGKIKLLER